MKLEHYFIIGSALIVILEFILLLLHRKKSIEAERIFNQKIELSESRFKQTLEFIQLEISNLIVEISIISEKINTQKHFSYEIIKLKHLKEELNNLRYLSDIVINENDLKVINAYNYFHENEHDKKYDQIIRFLKIDRNSKKQQ